MARMGRIESTYGQSSVEIATHLDGCEGKTHEF
jgi:hypothetical protein